MALNTKRLVEFLNENNAGLPKPLPMLHTTQSSNLINIINTGSIMALPCNVFQGEDLCYLFVGRPAYKYQVSGQSDYWMLPTVFVLRFQQPIPFKRIYPFDSGAFSKRRLPDYLTTFNRDDFALGTDPSIINKLISVYFTNEQRYWEREPSSRSDFRAKYDLGPLHMQIEALNNLYNDRSSEEFDDRAAAVEVQVDNNILLNQSDVLGIIVPEEFMREKSIKDWLGSLSKNIEHYGVHPINVSMYYGQVYESVRKIYSKYGIFK